MMGETQAGNVSVQKTVLRRGRPLLRLEALRATGDNGNEAVHGVDLTVNEGEIVGIAGVSGNGQRELVEAIGGQRAITSGRITVAGERHLPTRALLRKHSFFTLPEEPLRNASAPAMSVAENIAFRLFDRKPFRRAGFLLDRKAIGQFGRDMIQKFSIRPPDPDAPLGDLSGGNVQRADFKAVNFVHDRLIEARNDGAAVLLISEDLDELLALADRIFVMSEGELVYETTPEEADISRIGRHMAGHHEAAAVSVD
jgi:simple sugar transport system ATP-binding protein